ncbi:hypothetical protein CASFOL_036238 [Castilleja foliolosa]|uniref:CCHC-type domain-containing protein n=1 Tax=Castilleja foliolosa TaxID=1961234 RepID=A0ABD3BWK5_9LAMI
MSGGSRIEIEKFDGKRFDLWKMKMEDLLCDRDLWPAIESEKPDAEGSEKAAAEKKIEEWNRIDRKAKGLIRLCLADNILTNVMGEPTARDLWRKLESLYQSKSLVNKLFLRKKLYNLRMHEGDSFSAHLNEFNTLIGQLVSIGVKFEDDDKAITLLCSLPDSWDNLIVVIGGGDKELSYETVCAALLSEETRRRGSGNSNKEALAARGRSTEKSENWKGSRSKSRGRSKSKERKVKCWKCEEYGHMKRDCKNKAVHKKEESTSSGKDVETGDMYVATACMAQSDKYIWYIDTGASFHMTPHRHWFCEYELF